FEENETIKAKVEAFAGAKMLEISRAGSAKHDRSAALKALKEELIASFGEEPEEADIAFAKRYYDALQYYTVRNMILDESRRLAGRKRDRVRGLYIETDYLPSPHGSALFTRGETQSLTTVTLGTKDDELLVEPAGTSNYHNFLLRYN